jgi:carboxyl-terminal processing protease
MDIKQSYYKIKERTTNWSWRKILFITSGLILAIIIYSAGVVVGTNREINNYLNIGPEGLPATSLKNKDSQPSYLKKDVDFKMFWQVWKMVSDNFIDREKINNSKLFYGAVSGVVSALGDPYSIFFDPKMSQQFNEELSGEFSGIGAEIGERDGQITIVAPLPNTPAAKAGLKPKDAILAIDSLSTQGMAVDEAVSLIRGKKGTTVILTILPDVSRTAKEVSIVRDKIEIKSVVLEEKEGYNLVKLSSFNENTYNLFVPIEQKLITTKKPIVLDLRNNPGGFLDTAVKIAGYWIDSGKVVVSEDYKNNKDKNEYKSEGPASLKNIPIVVLVNDGSASAAEILAGSLQDYGLAKLVGVNTFGKGSVQQVDELSDGSSVKLTVARWLTPNGRTIDKEGLRPDVAIEADNKGDKDVQLEKALEVLKNPENFFISSTAEKK